MHLIYTIAGDHGLGIAVVSEAVRYVRMMISRLVARARDGYSHTAPREPYKRLDSLL